MLNLVSVRTTLRSRLTTMSGYIGDTLVAWEGRTFQPPEPSSKDVVWIRENLVQIDELLVSTNLVQGRGFIYYVINTVDGLGTKIGDDLALAVSERFKPASSIQGAVDIAIDRCERMSPIIEKPWRMIPVRILWRAYTPNP